MKYKPKHKKVKIDAGNYEYRGFEIEDWYAPRSLATNQYLNSSDRWHIRPIERDTSIGGWIGGAYALSAALEKIDMHIDEGRSIGW